MLPVDGMGLVLTIVTIMLDVELTVVGVNPILMEDNCPLYKPTEAAPEVSTADTSLPIVAWNGDVVIAGDGFKTELICNCTEETKVSLVIEFTNTTYLLAELIEHEKVAEGMPPKAIKSQVYDPSMVYYCGKVMVMLDPAGTA